MIIHPFQALRATPESAQTVASVPYDVVDTAQARTLAEDRPHSFLHVVRSEIDLPPETDLHTDVVYEKAAENLQALRADGRLVVEDAPSLYAYRITAGSHVQVGLLACCRVDDYESGVIKKHELTRRDKEDDRTRHILATRAQTGPVLLAYADNTEIESALRAATSGPALLAVRDEVDVQHEVWRIADPAAVIAAFGGLDAAYIADGHHRSASAARARAGSREQHSGHGGNEEYNFFLTVLFPASQLRILAYNRVVRDLGGLSADDVLVQAGRRFEVGEPSTLSPGQAGQVCIYMNSSWHSLQIKPEFAHEGDPVRSLDCSLIQEHFIEPILGVRELRTDPRISFIGGDRGPEALQEAVHKQGDGIAFSMYPTSIRQLMAIADAGEIMPPKSTWFDPKLRSGLVIHLI